MKKNLRPPKPSKLISKRAISLFQSIVFYVFIGLKRILVNVIKRLLWSNEKNMRGINTVIIVKIGGLGDFIFGVHS